MKRSKRLLLLLLVLVLTVAFVVLTTALAKREKEKQAENDESGTADTDIVFVDKTVKDVDSFTVKVGELDLSIYVEDGTYKLTSDENFPVDQIVAGKLALGVAKVSFLRKPDIVDPDPAEYGFDEPTAHFSAVYDDGSSIELTVGDYNRHTGGYYCRVKDGTVYLLSGEYLETFSYSKEDLLQDDYVKEPKEAIDSITEFEVLFRDGSGFTYKPVQVEVPADTAEDSTATETQTVWVKTLLDGTEVEGDFAEAAQLLYKELFKVSLGEWADYNVTGKDRLEPYGLAEPAVKITVRYTEKVIIAGESGSTNVTTTVDKVQGFLIGDLLPADEDDSADTEADTETGVPADTTADTSADTSADAEGGEEEEPEDRYYFMLEGNKIVYVVSAGNLTSLFGESAV